MCACVCVRVCICVHVCICVSLSVCICVCIVYVNNLYIHMSVVYKHYSHNQVAVATLSVLL